MLCWDITKKGSAFLFALVLFLLLFSFFSINPTVELKRGKTMTVVSKNKKVSLYDRMELVE